MTSVEGLKSEAPGHVPANLVWDHCLEKFNRELDDPFLAASRLRLDRYSGRLTFASGPHICLGAHLARREIRIVIETFLSRFENIHIPPGESYAYHTGVVLGVDRLPLAWTQRIAALQQD